VFGVDRSSEPESHLRSGSQSSICAPEVDKGVFNVGQFVPKPTHRPEPPAPFNASKHPDLTQRGFVMCGRNRVGC
jgi:hypothetical protein